MDVTVPDADREAGAAGVVDADAHASPPAPAALAPPTAALSSAAPRVLPSERLVRLAELAAAALDPESVAVSVGPSVLGEQALADVLAAVDASTAVNTKKAYRSDWARFTAWTTERGFAPLPAPALVVAHYVTEAAAEQTSVGKWRYTPATLSRWVSSINQFHTAAGLDAPGPGGGGPPGVVRGAADPGPAAGAAVTVAAGRHPHPGHLDGGVGRRVAGRGGGPAGHGVAVDGVRRRAPPVRARRADPGRRHPAPGGRSCTSGCGPRRPTRRPAVR